MTKIIDTHSHYNLPPLLESWPTHWAQAQAQGITHSIVVGTNLESSKTAVALATREPNFKATLGTHPSEYQELVMSNPETPVSTLIEQQLTELESLKSLVTDQVVAIGEVGLDYFRLPSETELQTKIQTLQQELLKAHLHLATELNLPVSLHVRDQQDTAYWQVLDILKFDYTGTQPVILHCVSGPLEYVQQAVALGAYVGLAGNLTYKKADHLRSIARVIDHTRLLSETDTPFLPPEPHRGQMCQPWMIKLTVEYLQEELGLDPEMLYRNAQQVFKLD